MVNGSESMQFYQSPGGQAPTGDGFHVGAWPPGESLKPEFDILYFTLTPFDKLNLLVIILCHPRI